METFHFDESQEQILVMIFICEDQSPEYIFSKLDFRNKGYLSIFDFTKILNQEYNIKPTIAFNLFKSLDIDSTGKITKHIFKILMSQLYDVLLFKPQLSQRKTLTQL